MSYRKTAPLLLFASLATGLAPVAGFAVETLDDETLRRAYQRAVEKYREEGPGSGTFSIEPSQPTPPQDISMPEDLGAAPADEADVALLESGPIGPVPTGYLPLEELRIAVDVENQSLHKVVGKIVSLAEEKTGPWQVKWRISPENDYLLQEKVNLTAETTFGDFMEHLSDRVNNMTGVRLGVTVFNMSRVIVISDTY